MQYLSIQSDLPSKCFRNLTVHCRINDEAIRRHLLANRVPSNSVGDVEEGGNYVGGHDSLKFNSFWRKTYSPSDSNLSSLAAASSIPESEVERRQKRTAPGLRPQQRKRPWPESNLWSYKEQYEKSLSYVIHILNIINVEIDGLNHKSPSPFYSTLFDIYW